MLSGRPERIVAGRIALIDRIGAGAVGSVWRAFDLRDERYCAAKLVNPQIGATTMVRAIREHSLRLAHPHVLIPHSWAADDDAMVLVMALVHGGSLETLVNDYGPLPAAFAAEILTQLLAALGHTHAEGAVHRDVKPANVLLEATGDSPPHTRLIDFGAALHPDGRRFTTAGFVVGTPGYVAPEVLEGGEPGPRQDLYAAGMVAWQMLTGAASPEAGQRFGPPPEGVPPALWSAVAGLCARDPRDRPADAASAIELLNGCGLVLETPTRTTDGEPIEIFDQLGPLPPGWGPQGPVPYDTGVGQGPPPDEPQPQEPQPQEPLLPETLFQERPGPEHGPLDRGHDPGPPRRAWPRRRSFIAVVIALALGSAVVGGVLAVRDGPDDRDRGSSVGSSSPSPLPSAQVGVPKSSVRAGAPCDWQYIGTVETATDGRRVRCTFRSGDVYYWRPVG